MEYGVVVLWWALYAALALAALPIAGTVFSGFRDRGAALALPAALVVLFVLVYWFGRVSFGAVTVWGAVAVLLVASAAVYVRWKPQVNLRAFGAWLGVFTVAFLLVIAIRAVDPAVHPGGGEKFLDYGLLRSVLRTSTLPPEDMWFAGEPVSYYYGGHLLSAILTVLTGTAPRYAYNLALAGFYGTLVSTAFGLAGSIAASRGSSYLRGGLFGAFFVGIASNLVPLVQLLLDPIPDVFATFIAERFATGTLQANELTGALEDPFGFSYYWTPSRVIDGTINEFPLFAWLNGDLHAHMMSTPFLLLFAGVVFAYYLTPEESLRRRRLLLFGVGPPIAGMLAVVNTWSFPSAAGLAFLGVLFAGSDPRTLVRRDANGTETWVGEELRRIGAALLAGGGVLLVGAIWVLPFLVGPTTGTSSRSIGVVTDMSGWSGLLLVHGPVLGVFVVYFLGRRGMAATRVQGWIVGAVWLGLLVLTVAVGAPAFALVAPLLLAGWVGLRRSDEFGFESVLFVAGAGLVMIVELVFLIEPNGAGRFNTVFKAYMQVWIIWGTAVGATVGILTPSRPLRAVADGGVMAFTPTYPGLDLTRVRQLSAAVLAVALVASLSIYGVIAVGGHLKEPGMEDPTLDATEFVTDRSEAPVIAWFDDREGTPNIVTAPTTGGNTGGRMYRWRPRFGHGGSAISSLTGVPTLMGWRHERGYRGPETFEKRLSDVESIYRGDPATRSQLLKRHNVEYIYVGPAEHQLYGDANVAVFESIDGVSLEQRWGQEMKVYRVNGSELG
jgi:YYY domain-containing protein